MILIANAARNLTATNTIDFFSRYKEAIFNRNLIISGAGAYFANAYVSQLYAQHDSNDLTNSVAALAVECGVYIPVFATLFYVDNRSKYVDPATGRRDSRQIRQDIKKLFVAFSVSEVIYSIKRS